LAPNPFLNSVSALLMVGLKLCGTGTKVNRQRMAEITLTLLHLFPLIKGGPVKPILRMIFTLS